MHWLREKYLNAGRVTEDHLGDAGKPARATFYIGPPGSTPDEPHHFTDAGWLPTDGLTHEPDDRVAQIRSWPGTTVRTLVTKSPATFELTFIRTGKNRAAYRANLRVLLGVGRHGSRKARAMFREARRKLAAERAVEQARQRQRAAYHARQRSRRRA